MREIKRKRKRERGYREVERKIRLMGGENEGNQDEKGETMRREREKRRNKGEREEIEGNGRKMRGNKGIRGSK